MDNRIQVIFIAISLVFLTSCGAKKAKMGSVAPEDAAVVSVIQNHYDKEVDFKTLQGRLSLNYQTEDRSQSVTVAFRMKKNDTIWMSGQVLGIPLAKVMITPNSVQFYEKITQTYFDGDFSLLSDLLGTPLDFQKVQNLLLGQAVYDLRSERYVLTESTRGYQLKPAEEDFLTRLFLLDAGNFKAIAQQLGQQSENRNVTITYPSYQKVRGKIFPEQINILANDGPENTRIDMTFRSIEFNVPVSFPFSIPSGYEEI